MNPVTFSPEVKQPSAIRVSERRQRASTKIDHTFFKKVYKRKSSQAALDEGRASNSTDPSSMGEVDYLYELAVQKLYARLPINSRQAKTVKTLRIKRLKKVLSYQAALELTLSDICPLSRNYVKQVGMSKEKLHSNRRSLVAAVRPRDFSGRFEGALPFKKKQSIDGSTINPGSCSQSDFLASTNASEPRSRLFSNIAFEYSTVFFTEFNSVTRSCYELDLYDTLALEHTMSDKHRSSSQQPIEAGAVNFLDLTGTVCRNLDITNKIRSKHETDDFKEDSLDFLSNSLTSFSSQGYADLIREELEKKEELNIDDFKHLF